MFSVSAWELGAVEVTWSFGETLEFRFVQTNYIQVGYQNVCQSCQHKHDSTSFNVYTGTRSLGQSLLSKPGAAIEVCQTTIVRFPDY